MGYEGRRQVQRSASVCLILLAHLNYVVSFGIPEFLEFGACAEADVVPDVNFEKVRETPSALKHMCLYSCSQE